MAGIGCTRPATSTTWSWLRVAVPASYVNDLPFLDSDVYKWLEAVAWALADPALDSSLADRLRQQLAETERLLRDAQQPDGYLDSHFQVRFPGERFVQLQWGHELYCAGHLIQAAVALHRTTGDPGLPRGGSAGGGPGRRHVRHGGGQDRRRLRTPGDRDRIGRALPGDRRRVIPGTSSLFRRPAWARTARRRPVWPALLAGPHYRSGTPASVEGHAVRQLYLLAGVADVYMETGDASLLQALERLWAEMVASKTYLTGGIGAHHSDEAFGDPYELPNERSYCETCAAICLDHVLLADADDHRRSRSTPT